MKKFLLSGNVNAALLILRIFTGSFMIYGHGWSKLSKFSEKFHTFSDPLGVSHEVSYLLTVGAEFFCSLLIIVGLFTRLAAAPLFFTMFVAVFIINIGDPWNKIELGLMYLFSYLVIFVAGPGRYSLDYGLWKKKI